jgi:UDP-N-acetylmuramoyl-L-alanyl-D-glutamate--2,6-diaminopimelate ligase
LPGALRAMRLFQALRSPHHFSSATLPEADFTGLTCDSRQVRPGALFVAIRGSLYDGHAFLREAAEQGAAAMVGEVPDPRLGIPYIQVGDSRLALAELAAAMHGYPARQLVMIGVTGTDGKTTTCNLIFQILLAAGIKPGMISTVKAVIGNHQIDTGLHVTTPEALELQAYLDSMVRAGISHCVLEATSHGLAQGRVAACDFDIGVVTNITHEHLDFHGSLDAYRQAKGQLFRGLQDSAPKASHLSRTAVLNLDDSSFGFLRQLTGVRVVSYGVVGQADIHARRVTRNDSGVTASVQTPDSSFSVQSSLPGDYNLANIMAAVACAWCLGLPQAAIQQGIAAMQGVPGRMEAVDLGQAFKAIVDFAHTPNALRQALVTARQQTSGQLIAVFGSAGLRDRQKRRMMAQVGAELADICLLTAEDPRTESLGEILEEMAIGARQGGGIQGETFFLEPDRGQALRRAVGMASTGDLVIACGKGHEQSMCFGEIEYPWDDRTAMRAAISNLLGLPGPLTPWLPTSGSPPKVEP